MSPTREDYLKAVEYKNFLSEKINNKELAEELQVSPPAVSEMLNKLLEIGKLERDALLGYKLTVEGKAEAEKLIRKHRLWEVFLEKYLGFSWDQVHAEAELLEHSTSDLLANRLNEFLQHPVKCPHGGKIYGNSMLDEHNFLQLSKVEPHVKVVVVRVSDEDKFLHYIISKGISLDSELEIIGIDEFDLSLELKLDKKIVNISNKAAREIFVSLSNH